MEKQILGKKNFWYYVELILVTPIWFANPSPTRKSWEEFKAGLIKHEHQYEDKAYEISRSPYDSTHWFECKHKGCNLVHMEHYPTQKGLEIEEYFFKRDPKGHATFEEFLKQETPYKYGTIEPTYS